MSESRGKRRRRRREHAVDRLQRRRSRHGYFGERGRTRLLASVHDKLPHTSGRSTTIPVTDFATFYITGYDGSPCTNPPITDHPDDPIPDRGTIVGHFIKYVDTLNSGGGTIICDPTSFGACVPVMTK